MIGAIIGIVAGYADEDGNKKGTEIVLGFCAFASSSLFFASARIVQYLFEIANNTRGTKPRDLG
jgi:hypothetical protein